MARNLLTWSSASSLALPLNVGSLTLTRPRIVVKGSSWLAMETRGGGSMGDSGTDGDSVGGGCAGEGHLFGA